MPEPLRPTAFLDRDGVLNVNHGYVASADRFEWVEGAPEAVRCLNDAGYLVIVVTNQSGIARGYYSEDDFLAFTEHMRAQLQQATGGWFDAVYFCPHGPDSTCECRKPSPGMIEQAIREWPVDQSQSFLIGDSQTDLEAASAANIPGHLFVQGSLLDLVRTLVPG